MSSGILHLVSVRLQLNYAVRDLSGQRSDADATGNDTNNFGHCF